MKNFKNRASNVKITVVSPKERKDEHWASFSSMTEGMEKARTNFNTWALEQRANHHSEVGLFLKSLR